MDIEKSQSNQKIFMWNVIAGVVASVLFLAVFQPLLTWTFDWLASTSVDSLNSYVDGLYKRAALGSRDWVIVALALLVMNAVFVLTVFFLFGTRRLTHWANKQAPLYLSGNEKSSSFAFRSILSIPFRLGLILMLLFNFGSISVSIFTDLQLNTSFNQRINALAPYVSDNEIKLLRSQWALMRSKADHEAINKSMNDLAIRKKIKLPLPLL